MTAPIVYGDKTRAVIPDYRLGLADNANIADIIRVDRELGHVTLGQLWERVPEGPDELSIFSPTYSARVREALAAAKLRRAFRRVDEWRRPSLDDPNQRVRMFGRYQRLAAGVILAGKRVK